MKSSTVKLVAIGISAIAMTAIYITPSLAESAEAWRINIELPTNRQNYIDRKYTHSNGCKVELTERVRTKEIKFGKNKVLYSYQCQRSAHKYSCKGTKWDYAAVGEADYENKVEFKYKVAGGLPKFSDYKDAGNTNETECGQIIIDHLKSISTP